MQANFEYCWKQLLGEIPGLPPQSAQRFVSNAWIAVQRAREWSWRHKEGLVLFPARLATGTINVTKNSREATLDATALAAWNADTQLPLLGNRQLRLPGTPDRVYSFEAASDFATSGNITLDAIYTGATNAVATYNLYLAYVKPLTRVGDVERNFERFITMRNLSLGVFISGAKSEVSQQQLNIQDRGRQFFGYPNRFSFLRHESTGTFPNISRYKVYEFWPHTVSEIAFESYYLTSPVSWEENPTDILPGTIDPRLVIYKALIEGYRWADSNRGSVEALRGTNWQLKGAALANEYPNSSETYPALLREHMREDDNYIDKTLLSNLNASPFAGAFPTTILVQPT